MQDFLLAAYLMWLAWVGSGGVDPEDCARSTTCPAHLY